MQYSILVCYNNSKKIHILLTKSVSTTGNLIEAQFLAKIFSKMNLEKTKLGSFFRKTWYIFGTDFIIFAHIFARFTSVS